MFKDYKPNGDDHVTAVVFLDMLLFDLVGHHPGRLRDLLHLQQIMPPVIEVAGKLGIAVAEDGFAETVPEGKSAPKRVE
jgi:hypothetical protein